MRGQRRSRTRGWGWGLPWCLLFASPALAAEARPAPGAPRPEVWTINWECENHDETSRGSLAFAIGLKQLPAVSQDGRLALAAHELVADTESDEPRPVTKVTPDVYWRSSTQDRVVLYFVELAPPRAEPAIGLLPSPNQFPADRSCRQEHGDLRQKLDGIQARLDARKWSRLVPLALNLDEPDRFATDSATTQRRRIGAARIQFTFPTLTIRLGQAAAQVRHHRLNLAGYPGQTREDLFGLLELEPAGVRTWLTDLWIEPRHGILVLRLMNSQLSDCVLGNAFTYFLRVSPEETQALCPKCATTRRRPGSAP